MASTNILDSIAVARRSEGEAATILQAYIATNPQMAYTYAPQAAPAPARASAPAAAGPGGAGMGGGTGGTRTAATTTTTTDQQEG